MTPSTSPPALPTNSAAQAANAIIKGIETALEPEIQAAIIAAVPTLGLPVVKQLIDEIETIIENKITVYLETGADFIIYDLQTTTENINVVAARAAYMRALQSGNQAAIAAARITYDHAVSAVANDDGGATTS